jgi:hypothetical protein
MTSSSSRRSGGYRSTILLKRAAGIKGRPVRKFVVPLDAAHNIVSMGISIALTVQSGIDAPSVHHRKLPAQVDRDLR